MLKVLFVVRGFYPDLSASGNLILPLLKEMKRHAIIHVLTYSNENKKEIIEDLVVHRIPNPKNSFNNIVDLFLRNFTHPYFNRSLVERARLAIEDLEKTYKYDVIISVTYEEILALVGAGIERHKKACFLLEKLHESSKFNFFKKLQRKSNEKKYEQIVNSLKHIFTLPGVVSEIKNLCNKVIEVEHPMVINNIRNINLKNSMKTLMVYAGGLDAYQRDPWPIINFLEKINIDIEFHIYGYGNSITSKSGLPSRTKYYGALDKERLNDVFDKASFLISIGNKESDIFPSKLFDYISTGIPIIHFSQNLKDPYYKYLKNYENALIVDIQSLHNFDNSEKLIVDFVSKRLNVRDSYENIRKRFKEQTPEYNSNIILSVING